MREDQHAQWDIRNIACQMHNLVKQELPLCGALLGGKDKFETLYKEFIET
jgi:hypothetical protein